MAGKHVLRTAALAGLGLFGLGLWTVGPLFQEARLSAAFAARQSCACVHLGGRGLEECVADLPGPSDAFSVAQQDDSVRVSVLGGVVSARAAYVEGYGCLLD